MNDFDNYVAQRMSEVSGHYDALDFVFLNLGRMNTFKIMPLIAGLFWIWARNEAGRRQAVIGTLGAFLALVAARIVQNLGPHRERPISSSLFDFPDGASNPIVDWSSFPSDTTALACALATGIFLASRRFGALAFGWAAFLAAAKLYGGFHYPSDVLAGAMVGVAATYAVHRSGWFVDWISDRLEYERVRRPGLVAAIAFVAAFQLATFFYDIRGAAKAVYRHAAPFASTETAGADAARPLPSLPDAVVTTKDANKDGRDIGG